MTRRTRRSLAALIAGATLSAIGFSAPASAAPTGLTLIAVRHSCSAHTSGTSRPMRGFRCSAASTASTSTHVPAVLVQDGRLAVTTTPATRAALGADRAALAATVRAGGKVRHADLVVVPGARATLAWRVLSDTDRGTVETIVDAADGTVVRSESLVRRRTAPARSSSRTPSSPCRTSPWWTTGTGTRPRSRPRTGP
jgi:hypothetical protein